MLQLLYMRRDYQPEPYSELVDQTSQCTVNHRCGRKRALPSRQSSTRNMLSKLP